MTTLAGWATLLVMLAVGAVGLKLARSQYLNLSGVLLDGERHAAESLRAALERQLDDDEARILGAISSAGPDLKALASLKSHEPLLDQPFLLSAEGRLFTPLEAGSSESRLLRPEQAPPEVFERAMAAFWGNAPLAEKIRALGEAADSPQSPPTWRLRARAQLLALESRAGDARLAAQGYTALFQEHAQLLLDGALPSFLQLTLARAECLEQAGDLSGSIQAVTDGLERLARKELAPSFADEHVYLGLAAERFVRLGKNPPQALAAIEAEHQEKQLTLAVFETLRGWALARIRVEAVSPDDGKPRHLVEERGQGVDRRVAFVVWTRPPPSADSKGMAAVGFRVASGGLEDALRRGLDASKQRTKLVISTLPRGTNDGMIDLASFRAERSFLRLGIEKTEWDRVVGEARQPFVIAGVLTGLLIVFVVLGLFAFLRGVRREMTLSRMKTEFVANVSHELKTPLALIRLFGETLLMGRGDPESREKYCRIITRESERLTHLISSVLSFASIEAGKKRYDLKPCDVAQVVTETFESYRHHLDAQGFTHRLEICVPEPAIADVDSNAVAESVINLLDNAVKYSKDHKDVAVRVETTMGEVRVSVEDRGVGISSTDQKRVFEDYYRTREARALGTRGSGLGLSLVQHILSAHAGRVELESRMGEGSKFTLVFPRRRAEKISDQSVERGATEVRSGATGRTT